MPPAEQLRSNGPNFPTLSNLVNHAGPKWIDNPSGRSRSVCQF